MKLLVADDHQLFRESLRALLERQGYDIVADAADGRQAARLARRLAPDLVILDLAMPLLNGIDAARQIGRHAPGTKTVLVTGFDEPAQVLGALQAGVRGYVLKAQAAADLIRAIEEVMRGAIYLSPGISRIVVDAYLSKAVAVSEPLTDRERHVLQLVAEGCSSKEIAVELGVGSKTVESHRTHMMHKLDIHNTAGLVRYAIRRGLVRA